MKFLSVAIQMKATEQFFPVVFLWCCFVTLSDMVKTFVCGLNPEAIPLQEITTKFSQKLFRKQLL